MRDITRTAHLCATVSIVVLGVVAAGAEQAHAQGTSSRAGSAAQPSSPTATVELNEIVVDGASSEGQAPSTGTVGQPPAPYAGGQVGSGTRLGMLGNRSILETPFNVTGFTEKLIRDQQSQSVADVALNDPSVRSDAPPFSERDAFFIRGFSVTNLDIFFDGLPYIANPRRHFLEGIERVEILKGPSAFINGGTGRVGGTINLVPKRATDEPITRVTGSYRSDTLFWPHLDVGRRFGEEGEWGIRVNGSYRNGDTAFDNNEAEVGVASLGLDYRGERVRASLDLNHSTQNLDAPTSLFNGLAAGVPVPRAPDGRTNTANPWEYHDSTYNMAAARVEADILANTTVYAAAGASRYREDFLTSSYSILNEDGDATNTFGFQPQQIQGFSGEVGIRSEFETGWIGHRVNLSVSRSLNENYRGGFAPGGLGLPLPYPTNIYDPVYVPPFDTSNLPESDDLPLFQELLSTSYVISDTLSFFDERLQVTLGGRFQQMRLRGYNTRPDRGPVGVQNYFYEEDRFSPAVAALVRVTDELSVYGNYVEALTEGPIAPTTGVTNPGEIFSPTVNEQKEIGVKYDFGPFALTTSLFEIRQPSAFNRANPGSPLGTFVVDGLQVNRGLEFSAFGEVTPGFRLLGGVTFIDAELENTADGPDPDLEPDFNGNRAPGVPRTAISLYGEYDMPWVEGLTVTGRLLYNGSTFYNQGNTQKVSDWTRVDAGLRYAFEDSWGNPVVVRAGVENVFDENYWSSSARGFLAVGAPRTFTLSASIDF